GSAASALRCRICSTGNISAMRATPSDRRTISSTSPAADVPSRSAGIIVSRHGPPMMKLLDTLHRWTGGLIGLVLALLGLSGTILLHKYAWIGVAHAGDPLRTDLASTVAATERIMALPQAPQGIIYASDGFGLHQARFGDGAGLYA